MQVQTRYIPAFKGIVLGQRFDNPAAVEAWTAWPDSRQGYACSRTASRTELEKRAIANLLAQPGANARAGGEMASKRRG